MGRKLICDKREYVRSIRISAKTKDYVDQHIGNSFNDKLERIIEISRDGFVSSQLDIEKAYLWQKKKIERYQKIVLAIKKINIIIADINEEIRMLEDVGNELQK